MQGEDTITFPLFWNCSKFPKGKDNWNLSLRRPNKSNNRSNNNNNRNNEIQQSYIK